MQLPKVGDRLIQRRTYVVGTVETIWFSNSDEKYWVFCRITKEVFFVCPLDQTKPTKEVKLAPDRGKYLE